VFDLFNKLINKNVVITRYLEKTFKIVSALDSVHFEIWTNYYRSYCQTPAEPQVYNRTSLFGIIHEQPNCFSCNQLPSEISNPSTCVHNEHRDWGYRYDDVWFTVNRGSRYFPSDSLMKNRRRGCYFHRPISDHTIYASASSYVIIYYDVGIHWLHSTTNFSIVPRIAARQNIRIYGCIVYTIIYNIITLWFCERTKY